MHIVVNYGNPIVGVPQNAPRTCLADFRSGQDCGKKSLRVCTKMNERESFNWEKHLMMQASGEINNSRNEQINWLDTSMNR